MVTVAKRQNNFFPALRSHMIATSHTSSDSWSDQKVQDWEEIDRDTGQGGLSIRTPPLPLGQILLGIILFPFFVFVFY